MGLSNALSGGIVMVALISVLLTVPGIVGTTSIVQDASTEIADVELKIANTQISLSLLSATNGDDLITFTLSNVGTEKLWNYDKFNIFVTYDEDSTRYTESLTYAGDCSGEPSAGNWCVSSISNDNLDPGILNQNEDMSIQLKVNQNTQNGIVIVVLSVDNGETTTISTTVGT